MLRGEYGPDLEEVAHYHGLQVEDVIRIHSETTYFVYMLGFTPGFPYLGGLSKELETPRKNTTVTNLTWFGRNRRKSNRYLST